MTGKAPLQFGKNEIIVRTDLKTYRFPIVKESSTDYQQYMECKWVPKTDNPDENDPVKKSAMIAKRDAIFSRNIKPGKDTIYTYIKANFELKKKEPKFKFIDLKAVMTDKQWNSAAVYCMSYVGNDVPKTLGYMLVDDTCTETMGFTGKFLTVKYYFMIKLFRALPVLNSSTFILWSTTTIY